MWFMKEVCLNASQLAIYNSKNIQKLKYFWPHTSFPPFAPTPIEAYLVRRCCALYSKRKVGVSASMSGVTSCVYCWVHFVNIAKMHGNLFSGRPSKVLPWSWLKSLGLGLGLDTHSLGLGQDQGQDCQKHLIYITAANGLKTNDVIEDCRHWRAPSPARRHWWGAVRYL